MYYQSHIYTLINYILASFWILKTIIKTRFEKNLSQLNLQFSGYFKNQNII